MKNELKISHSFDYLIGELVKHMPLVAALGLDWRMYDAYPWENDPSRQPLVAPLYTETRGIRYDAFLRKSAPPPLYLSWGAINYDWRRAEGDKRHYFARLGDLKNGQLWFDEEVGEAIRIMVTAKRERRKHSVEESEWLQKNNATSIHYSRSNPA
jgi:hypothetical protein